MEMKNRGFNVKKYLGNFNVRNLLGVYKVFAEEPAVDPNAPPAQQSTTAPTSTAIDAMLERVRTEEKNKLYKRITGLEGQIETLENKIADLTTKRSAELKVLHEKEESVSALEKELESLKTNAGKTESDVVKDLRKQLKEAQNEFNAYKETVINEDELREQIKTECKAEYDLALYKNEKIASANGKIIPELVTGTTNEEIDASVEAAMNRYNEIIGATTTAPAPQSPVVPPASNPNFTPQQTQAQNMKALLELDPLSEEYAKLRKKLGFK